MPPLCCLFVNVLGFSAPTLRAQALTSSSRSTPITAVLSPAWATRALIATSVSTSCLAALQTRRVIFEAKKTANLRRSIDAHSKRIAVLEASLQDECARVLQLREEAQLMKTEAKLANFDLVRASEAMEMAQNAQMRAAAQMKQEAAMRKEVEKALAEAKQAGAEVSAELLESQSSAERRETELKAEVERLEVSLKEARALTEDKAEVAEKARAEVERTQSEVLLKQEAIDRLEESLRAAEAKRDAAENARRSEASAADDELTAAKADLVNVETQLAAKQAELEAAAVEAWRQAKSEANREVMALQGELEELRQEIARTASQDGPLEAAKTSKALPSLPTATVLDEDLLGQMLGDQAALAAKTLDEAQAAWSSFDTQMANEREALDESFAAQSSLDKAVKTIRDANWQCADLRVRLAHIEEQPEPSGLMGWWEERQRDAERTEVKQKLDTYSTQAATAYTALPTLLEAASGEENRRAAALSEFDAQIAQREEAHATEMGCPPRDVLPKLRDLMNALRAATTTTEAMSTSPGSARRV